jgi:molybdate transport system substrate-binding protein
MRGRITGISSMATRQILADLVGPYEQRTGCRVEIRAMGGVDAARRIRAGEPTDVIILASNVMEQLEAEGHVVSGSQADFARSGIAMAVPSGAPRPSVDDEQSVKQAMSRCATRPLKAGAALILRQPSARGNGPDSLCLMPNIGGCV